MNNCKDLKISEMPKADHLHGEDLIPIVQHGRNKVIDVQDLVDLFKRILPPPPPPKPCPEPWYPEPYHHHHHCNDYCGIDIIGKVREDAAIAKASASAVEGKVAVLEKTADVALDSSQRAMNIVKTFESQIDQIRTLGLQVGQLEAKVFNDRNKIDQLTTGLLLLTERVKDLERKLGVTPSEMDFSPSWLSHLQNPFNHCHHRPCNCQNSETTDNPGTTDNSGTNSDMTSTWVDENVVPPTIDSEWVDDNVTNPNNSWMP